MRKYNVGDEVKIVNLMTIDEHSGYSIGDIVTIKRYERKKEFSDTNNYEWCERQVTLHKKNSFKVGDIVYGKTNVGNTVDNGVVLAHCEKSSSYKIVYDFESTGSCSDLTSRWCNENEIFLGTRPTAKPQPKELTLKQVIDELGYEVKIVK